MDNYEVLRPIGKGKFAVVYRAKRKADGELVALKKISIDMMDEKAREKCLKEVRLLQSLDHPNIIKYLDSFLHGTELVIVVEWAAAGDLKRQLRKAQEKQVLFEERVIWKYFSQICEAIRHMHERRILHRDLKPANIFLTTNGVVKVGDLGLGRSMSEHSLEAHSKVGTPLYMSPEVLRGDGYDWKSDIWSLGCLLYELAMLKSPFKAEGLNLYSLFQKISHGDYAPLPEHYSRELRELAYAMISINASERPDIIKTCKIAQQMRARTAKSAQSPNPAASVSSNGYAAQAGEAAFQQAQEPSPMERPEGADMQRVNGEEQQAEGKSPTYAGDRPQTAKWQAQGDAGSSSLKRRTSGTYLQQVEAKAAASLSTHQQQQQQQQQPSNQQQSPPQAQQQRADGDRQQLSPPQLSFPGPAAGNGGSSSGRRPSVVRGSVDDQHEEEERTEAVAAAVGPVNDIGARPASRRMSTRGQAVGGRTAATPLAADVSPAQQQAELPGEALGLMEAVWDLVTLLSALPEAKGPLRPPRLSRVHFAIEGSRQARLSRHQQFLDLTILIPWLLQEAKLPPLATSLAEFDAPIVVATAMLNAVKDAGYPDSSGRLTPLELTRAWGVPVCQLLYWLASQAAKARLGRRIRPLVYKDMETTAAAATAPGAPALQEDITPEDIEARDMTSLASSQGGEDEEGDALCMVEPAEDEEGCRDRRRQQEEALLAVDPVQWRAEVERVGPRLAAGTRRPIELTGDWAGHISGMHRYLNKFWPGDSRSQGRPGPMPSSCQSLVSVSSQLESEREAVAARERLLQSDSSLRELVDVYRNVTQEVKVLEEAVNRQANAVLQKTRMLDDLNQTVAEVGEKIQEATAAASGVDALVTMRRALAKLTAEVREMTAREGILEARLMRCRAKCARAALVSSGQRAHHHHRAATADSGTDVLSDVNLLGCSVADDLSDLDWTELSRPRTEASNSTAGRASSAISSSIGPGSVVEEEPGGGSSSSSSRHD